MIKNKKEIIRDKEGKFLPGHQGGPGRPLGSLNRYTRIRKDILDVWHEENGKEKFRQYFKSHFTFERALKIILAISPKLKISLSEDKNGTRSMTIEDGSTESD